MKTIYFVRHAKSSWDETGLRDIDRPLNKRGKRDAPMMAAMLAQKGIQADCFISSPANRALSTAEIFAAHLGVDDIRVEPRLYEAFPEDVLHIIQSMDQSCQTAFLFGHNPTFYFLASTFSDTDLDNVPTCGIFVVQAAITSWSEFNSRTARLMEFYYPKQFYT